LIGFPAKVWVPDGPPEKHYLQVTDDQWRKASELAMVCGCTCGSISSPAEAITKTHETTKPSEMLGSDG
jgi:hypothetical protein